MWHKQGTKRSGFTLVELLIVISIIAILAALALPSYQGSVRKARRSDAQAELTEFAGSMERRFTQTNSYTGLTLPANSDFYTFSFVDAVTATTYTIGATPTAVQSEDACGTMNLDQDGNKTHTGSLAGCWD